MLGKDLRILQSFYCLQYLCILLRTLWHVTCYLWPTVFSWCVTLWRKAVCFEMGCTNLEDRIWVLCCLDGNIYIEKQTSNFTTSLIKLHCSVPKCNCEVPVWGILLTWMRQCITLENSCFEACNLGLPFLIAPSCGEKSCEKGIRNYGNKELLSSWPLLLKSFQVLIHHLCHRDENDIEGHSD